MLKYLRIAVTALSLTACVLLIVLWVRSYWRFDEVEGRMANCNIFIKSVQGRLRSGAVSSPRPQNWSWRTLLIGSESYGLILTLPGGKTLSLRRVFSFSSSAGRFVLWVPTWLPTLIFAAFAAAAWLAQLKRFSLRTLLIATTLVAVGLGAVIYLVGKTADGMLPRNSILPNRRDRVEPDGVCAADCTVGEELLVE